jgi:hypothetical protein
MFHPVRRRSDNSVGLSAQGAANNARNALDSPKIAILHGPKIAILHGLRDNFHLAVKFKSMEDSVLENGFVGGLPRTTMRHGQWTRCCADCA